MIKILREISRFINSLSIPFQIAIAKLVFDVPWFIVMFVYRRNIFILLTFVFILNLTILILSLIKKGEASIKRGDTSFNLKKEK